MTGDGNFLPPRGSPPALPALSETAALAILSRMVASVRVERAQAVGPSPCAQAPASASPGISEKAGRVPGTAVCPYQGALGGGLLSLVCPLKPSQSWGERRK